VSLLTFPNDIQNGDLPDADEVMANFNAVKAFLDALGIDSGGIPYASLDLASSILNGDLANNAVTASKIAAPTTTLASIPSNVTSAGANIPATIATVAAPATGTYLISANATYSRTNASVTQCDFRSRLYQNFTLLYPEQRTNVHVSTANATIELPHQHVTVRALTAADQVTLQGDSVQSGTFYNYNCRLELTRIANG